MRTMSLSQYGTSVPRWRAATVLVAIALLFGSAALGKAKREHCKDYQRVLGISDPRGSLGCSNLQGLCDSFAKQIDSVGEFYPRKVKNDSRFGGFAWGPHSHRLFFHWGFNADPKKHAPLVKQVKSRGWSPKVEEEFFELIEEEQGRRNRKMMAAVQRGLGVYPRRRKNALASIIYDVHLLGDVEEQGTAATGQAVQELPGVVADIRDAIGKRLFKDRSGTQLAKDVEKAIGGQDPDSRKAERVLKLLESRLPSLLKKGDDGLYRAAFRRKGLDFD